MLEDIRRAMELDALEEQNATGPVIAESLRDLVYPSCTVVDSRELKKLKAKQAKDALWRYNQGPLPTDF